MEQIPESILERQTVEPEKPKNRWKIRVAFVAIIFLVLGVVIGARAYKLWKEVDDADLFAVKMAELKALQEADTFGGKTPYETLEMYISAVEKGDFQLASKYFVIEKQEEYLSFFRRLDNEKIKELIQRTNTAIQSEGSYSPNNDQFESGGSATIDLVKYPKGIWKITEI